VGAGVALALAAARGVAGGEACGGARGGQLQHGAGAGEGGRLEGRGGLAPGGAEADGARDAEARQGARGRDGAPRWDAPVICGGRAERGRAGHADSHGGSLTRRCTRATAIVARARCARSTTSRRIISSSVQREAPTPTTTSRASVSGVTSTACTWTARRDGAGRQHALAHRARAAHGRRGTTAGRDGDVEQTLNGGQSFRKTRARTLTHDGHSRAACRERARCASSRTC